MGQEMIIGAESSITFEEETITKRRIRKGYRIREIDENIRKRRTRREIKVMEKLSGVINVPKIISKAEHDITMQRINGKVLKDAIDKTNYKRFMRNIGKMIGDMHNKGIIHGDLTTSNFIVTEKNEIYLIDFGLSYFSSKVEDMAVDLHVLHEALIAKHSSLDENMFNYVIDSYEKVMDKDVIKRLNIVESRGRNKSHKKTG